MDGIYKDLMIITSYLKEHGKEDDAASILEAARKAKKASKTKKKTKTKTTKGKKQHKPSAKKPPKKPVKPKKPGKTVVKDVNKKDVKEVTDKTDKKVDDKEKMISKVIAGKEVSVFIKKLSKEVGKVLGVEVDPVDVKETLKELFLSYL